MSTERIVRGLDREGLRGRIVPVARLPELERDVVSLRESGQLDKAVYDAYISGFTYKVPADLPEARYIIVVAVPQPKLRVHFSWKGKVVPAVVPPTYANSLAVFERVRKTLIGSLEPNEARFVRATLPMKTLATRTGLAKYGRNNIAYIPDYGSFHRLVGFFTDLDLRTDHWQEREALPACKTCRLCMEACPASVIDEDRFLIRVERCLTWFNEMPSDKEFPEQIRPDWHNAIIGCMKCQEACPYDKKVKGWTVEGECFTEEETEYLVRGDFSDPRAEGTKGKLERCGLDLTIFPRNLKALLGR